MKKSNWTFDQLKSQLSKYKEIKDWIINEEHLHRRERYFMSESGELAIDQDRNVHARTISIRLFVNLPNKPGRHGEILKRLFPFMPLDIQIEQAIQSALETDHQAWALPTEIPKNFPELKTTDPKMAEDLDGVMHSVTEKIAHAVRKPRNTQFNSAELFLSVHHYHLHLSNGLNYRTSQSRIYTETAFSFKKSDSQGNENSDEYLSTQWSVQLADLPIEKIFDEASFRAERSLDTTKPLTGRYSVIIDSEVLSTLLNGHLSQLSAFNAYTGLPFIKPGDEFIPQAKGDLLSLTLDPTLPYGANTIAVSDQGMIQTPLQLVDKNRVITIATDKQYGDYLNMNPNTVRGNLVVDPGTLSYEELTRQDSQVIEILQFSGLFADVNSGTFSSEIRLARLFDNKTGQIKYLKGGSLSGSISENFQCLKLSQSRVNRAHFSSDSAHGHGYYGPEFALLSNVSIVG